MTSKSELVFKMLHLVLVCNLCVANLDHNEFLLFGFPVGPVFPETEVDLKGWRIWCLTFLEQDQSCGQKNVSASGSNLLEVFS